MSESETRPFTLGRSPSVWRVLLFGQLLGTSVLWVGICLAMQFPSSHRWPDVLFFVLLVWQCELLGFWAGFGRSVARFLVIAFAVPTLVWTSNVATGGGEIAEFAVFCLGVFGVVAMTTGLLRRFAGSLDRVEPGLARREALRFGIQHVMIWTAGLALFFGVFRVLVQVGIGTGGVSSQVEIFLLACCMSFCSVASVWAIMGTRILPSRTVGMVLVTGFAVTLTQLLSREWLFSLSTLLSQLLIWLTLALLRWDGYRFLKRDAS